MVHIFDSGASPAVDGLIVISDGGDLPMSLGQQLEPAVLNGVAVLEFIYQDVLKALLVVLQQRRCLLQKFEGAQKQFREID